MRGETGLGHGYKSEGTWTQEHTGRDAERRGRKEEEGQTKGEVTNHGVNIE